MQLVHINFANWVKEHLGEDAGAYAQSILDAASKKAVAIDWGKVLSGLVNGLVAKKPWQEILAQIATDLGVVVTPPAGYESPTAIGG